MKSSEILAHVLEDHAALRADLDRLEVGARRLQAQPTRHDAASIRRDAQRLLDKLRSHMRWEELHMLPALRGADAWGDERATRLLVDHREQQTLLDFVLDRLLDEARPDALLFSDVFALIAFLREDMRMEEDGLADARVLRDDVIGIEVETG
jgi:iron-sulfur cluster repair protein YtfE (RIC family)